MLISLFKKGQVSFFLYDHLGNTRVTYTPTGFTPADPTVSVINEINTVVDYFPYGKMLREFQFGDQERYLTTQHERDQETDWDYRGARFYDSDVSRFLSLDPHARNYPSLSDYCYVAGNPIVFADPDGKDIEWGVKGKEKRELKRTVRFRRRFDNRLDRNGTTFNQRFIQWRNSNATHTLYGQGAPSNVQQNRGTSANAGSEWSRLKGTDGDAEHHIPKQRIQFGSQVGSPLKISNSGVGSGSANDNITGVSIQNGFIRVKQRNRAVADRTRVTSNNGAVNIDTGMQSRRDTQDTNVQNFNGTLNVSVNQLPAEQNQGGQTYFRVIISVYEFTNGKTTFTNKRGAFRKAQKNGFIWR